MAPNAKHYFSFVVVIFIIVWIQECVYEYITMYRFPLASVLCSVVIVFMTMRCIVGCLEFFFPSTDFLAFLATSEAIFWYSYASYGCFVIHSYDAHIVVCHDVSTWYFEPFDSHEEWRGSIKTFSDSAGTFAIFYIIFLRNRHTILDCRCEFSHKFNCSFVSLLYIIAAIIQWSPSVTGELICSLLGTPIVLLGIGLLTRAHFAAIGSHESTSTKSIYTSLTSRDT